MCHQPTITAISWPPAWISQIFLHWPFLNWAAPFFTAWLFLSRYKLLVAIAKAKPSWFTVYRPRLHVFYGQSKIFIIQCSSLYNHFSDSAYVWAAFTAKIMVLGTNEMMVYPLESFKLSASFQEFLQSLRECTNEMFNS